MRNRKNLLAGLIIVGLLSLTYLIPSMVTAVEDRNLQSENKSYEIAEINLNSEGMSLEEKLLGIQEVLTNNVLVQKYDGEEQYDEGEPYDKEEQKNTQSVDVKEAIVEFLYLLSGEIKPNEISEESLIMVDSQSEKVYSLRKCYVVDQYEQAHILWMDDETGKVLAFNMAAYVLRENTNDIYELPGKLAWYYEMKYGEFADISEEFWNENEYYQTALFFGGEDENNTIPLMFYKDKDRIVFNMYP